MIKELNEFAKELKLYRENNTLPQGDVKNKLADIYEANFKPKWGLRKIDRGCPSCISDMMKCLCAEWYDSLKDFKGVPEYNLELDEGSEVNISLVDTEEYHAEPFMTIQRDLEDQISEEEDRGVVVIEVGINDSTMLDAVNYQDLDTEGLRELCDTLGVKYHHKNKIDTLIKKLDKYFND